MPHARLPTALALLIALSACRGKNDETAAPTWHQDIAPVLSENCTSCHTDGGIQPDILFDDAQTASDLSAHIADAVTSRRMPPFYAAETEDCSIPWGWTNDARLSDDEIALIADWADAGGPLGEEASAAELPSPPSFGLDDPDAIYEPHTPWTTSVFGETEDEFVCFAIDPQLEEDAYITAFEVIPGDLSVVHHVLVGVDSTAQSDEVVDETGTYDCFGGFGVDANFIGGWVPSAAPIEAPEHSGFLLPAGSRLLLQMHYHLVDEPRSDATSLAVVFAEETPAREAMVLLMGNLDSEYDDGSGLQAGPNDEDGIEFRIPAGVADHTETMSFDALGTLTRPLDVFLMANHMHYVGTDMRTWVERGEDAEDPEDACLLQTPEWDFDWQQFYFYDVDGDNAPRLYGGDEIWLQCTYDNTTANPGLVNALDESGLDAPVDVFLGDGTLDEMCIGVFGMVLDVEFETESETHTGELNGGVTVLGLDVACEGMSSLSVTDEQVTGLARCGLEIVGGLYTFEMDLSGDIVDGQVTGTATFGVVGLSETFELDLSGTSSDDGIDLHSEGSGTMDGYEIDVSMDVVAP